MLQSPKAQVDNLSRPYDSSASQNCLNLYLSRKNTQQQVCNSYSMAQPRVLQQAAASGGFLDSEAEGGMEWTTPFDFGLDTYNGPNTASNGLQHGQINLGASSDPFVFSAHSEQFSMAHDDLPNSGAREQRESDGLYHRDNVAQFGQNIGTHVNGPSFGASAFQANTFDLENLLVSPITNGSSGIQQTIDPVMLSQPHWPGSGTDSTSSSFGDRSSLSELETHSSSSSFGEQSTNSSFKSDNQKNVSSQMPTSNKRRRCELGESEPGASSEQGIQIVYSNATTLEVDQNAVSMFERWLADCPSIYPGDQDFANLAFLTKASVQTIRSWFGKRLRERRVDDSIFEVWLSNYPTVYPGEEEFETLASLTRLNVETVRMWFVQKLRRKIANAPTPTRPSLGRKSEQPTELPIRTSTSSSANDPLWQEILHNAALWVRNERGTKCTASLDPSVLLRDDRKPFQCTRKCGKKFKDRDDWRKHEELNYPQEGWICDLPTTVVVAGIAICTSCGRPDPDPDHFAIHKKPLCQAKAFNARGRLHHRKQHFLQHFDNVHPHIPCDDYLVDSHFIVDSNFPRRCGFCLYRFLHWRDRVDHIGFHFHDEGRDMSDWNDTDDEEDHGHGDQRDHDRDEEDRDHGDASDSSDEDDSDDRPPRPAVKRSTKSKSAVGRTKSASQPSQTQFSIFNEMCDIQVLSPSGNQKSFKRDLQIKTGPPSETSEDDRWSLIRALPYLHWSKHLTSLKIHPYTRVRVLGCGPYSVVDEVRNLATGAIFARKTINYPRQRAAKPLNTEVEIMKKLNHPHIVQFIETYSLDQSFSILMIPSADFDLGVFMSTHQGQDRVPMDTVVQWFSCLISSLQYLHAQSIKHQDIKPSNILVKGQTIFLADFGIAKTFVDSEPTTSTSGDMTKKYCSPETVKAGMRGRKADIFSLGCVFLEMFSFLIHNGEPNFKKFQDTYSLGDGAYHENLLMVKKWVDILREQHFVPEQPILPRLLDICEVMLEESTENRPTAVELSANLLPGQCCLLPESSKSTLMRNVIDNAKVALVALRPKAHLDLPIQVDNLVHASQRPRSVNILQTSSSSKIHTPIDLETDCTSARAKAICSGQLTWWDTCGMIINRMIGSGVFSCFSVMATLIGTIILSLGVSRPLSLSTSRSCGIWTGPLPISGVASPDLRVVDTDYMDSYCYRPDDFVANLSQTDDDHSWERSMTEKWENSLHVFQSYCDIYSMSAWDLQPKNPEEFDDDLAQGRDQKDSETEDSPATQNAPPRFTNSSATSAPSPGEYIPHLPRTAFNEDDFPDFIQSIPHVSWLSWTWSKIVLGTILPGMIFVSTIPRKKTERSRIHPFTNLMILLQLIADPLDWIIHCLAFTAPIMLGGIYEAVLDFRIISCLKKKSQCSFPTKKTSKDLAIIGTAYEEWGLHERHQRISGWQCSLVVLGGLVGSILFFISKTTLSITGPLGILAAYTLAGVLMAFSMFSIAEMVAITALWRLWYPFISRLRVGNSENTTRHFLRSCLYTAWQLTDDRRHSFSFWLTSIWFIVPCFSISVFVNLSTSSEASVGPLWSTYTLLNDLVFTSISIACVLKHPNEMKKYGPITLAIATLFGLAAYSSARTSLHELIPWIPMGMCLFIIVPTQLLLDFRLDPSLHFLADFSMESSPDSLSSYISARPRDIRSCSGKPGSHGRYVTPLPAISVSSDSEAMKTVATLSIVFLPSTAIAALFTLFSMSMRPDTLLIFWTATVSLAGIILLAWILWPKAQEKRQIVFRCSPKGRGNHGCGDEVHLYNDGRRLYSNESHLYKKII